MSTSAQYGSLDVIEDDQETTFRMSTASDRDREGHMPTRHGKARHCTALHYTAQHGTAQHSKAQRSAAQHNTAWHSEYSTVLFSVK